VNDAAPRAPLALRRLQEAAGPPWLVRLYDAAESTNALAAEAPEPHLVVVADHQTAGRGRLGREWVTPAGAALTFSTVVDPALDDQWWPLVPLVAGYAVAQAVGGSLKWPNDVLLHDLKVSGILVERVAGGDRPLAVVGIGLNVDQTAPELPVPTATSLALAGRARDRTDLFGDVLTRLGEGLEEVARSPEAWMAGYRDLCATVGTDVRVDLPGGEVLAGRAVDVDDHGRLVVRSEGRAVPVAAGDVVHVRPSR
jgi:BirA family biotin operon repressor/biotin-[acetyl-CoA-carboxylase] ligase